MVHLDRRVLRLQAGNVLAEHTETAIEAAAGEEVWLHKIKRRVLEKDGGDERVVILSEHGGDDGAQRVADDDRWLTDQAKEPIGVADVVTETVVTWCSRRATVTTKVERIGAPVVAEALDHRGPARAVGREAVQEDQRAATSLPGRLVIHHRRSRARQNLGVHGVHDLLGVSSGLTMCAPGPVRRSGPASRLDRRPRHSRLAQRSGSGGSPLHSADAGRLVSRSTELATSATRPSSCGRSGSRSRWLDVGRNSHRTSHLDGSEPSQYPAIGTCVRPEAPVGSLIERRCVGTHSRGLLQSRQRPGTRAAARQPLAANQNSSSMDRSRMTGPMGVRFGRALVRPASWVIWRPSVVSLSRSQEPAAVSTSTAS